MNQATDRAIHQGPMVIGSVEMLGVVTRDHVRGLTMRTLVKALDQNSNQRASDGVPGWPAVLVRKGLEPYLGPVLAASQNQPFEVLVPQYINGRFIRDNLAQVVRAEALVDICKALVMALQAGVKLSPAQRRACNRALELLVALAGKAMRDWVDEATGFVVKVPHDQVEAIIAQNEKLIQENAAMAADIKNLRSIRDLFVDAEGTLPLGVFGKKLRELGVRGAGAKNIFKTMVDRGKATVKVKQGRSRVYYEYEPMQKQVERGCLFPKFHVRPGRKGQKVAPTSMTISYKGAVEFYEEELATADQLSLVHEPLTREAFLRSPHERKAIRARRAGAEPRGHEVDQAELFEEVRS